MSTHRRLQVILWLAIIVMVALTIGGALSPQRVASSAAGNHLAPLEWYFAHDHAILDGDNNVLVGGGNPPTDPVALREWYLLFDRTLFTGGQ